MPQNTMPIWVDIVVKLTPAFITMVVGLAASYIAYLQHKTNRDKFRLDLFSRRLEAFEKLQEYFAKLVKDGYVGDEILPILAEARYKSRFLFGPEIKNFFEELWSKAVDMRALRTRLYGPGALPVGPERNAVCHQEHVLMRWNMEQMKTADERYAPYMRFDR